MKRKYIVAVLMVSLIAALLYGLYDMAYGEDQAVSYQVSVILPYDGDGGWRMLEAGIKQAAEDGGLNVNYIVLPSSYQAEDQKDILWREIENGAQGILIAVDDREQMEPELKKAVRQVKIVTLESAAVDAAVTDMSGAHYQMGQLLGQEISAAGQFKIAVIKKASQRDYVQERINGLADGTAEDTRITYLEYQDEQEDVAGILRKVFWSTDYDSVVCLDALTLERCSDYFHEFRPKAKLYGIGGGNKIITMIDNGTIEGIVYQNEFTLGYLGAMKLADLLWHRHKDRDHEIEFSFVTADNLYDTKRQDLLFPILE